MPYVEFHRWILAAVLAMARIGGAFAICPALTESMIPGLARRAAVLGFAVLAIPFIHAGMPPGEPIWWMFALLAFKEALIGFLIGFFAAIPFWIAENIGNFIDNQRGATMGEVYSPLSGAQVSTTGIFFTQIVSTLFFVSGAVLSRRHLQELRPLARLSARPFRGVSRRSFLRPRHADANSGHP